MVLKLASGTVGAVMVGTGIAATVTLGAGILGSVLLARRICEERKGWRDGAKAEPEADAATL